MNRTNVALVALAVLVLTTGCLSTVRDESPTSDDRTLTSHDDVGDGQFTAMTVSKAPPNSTVVNYSDERVRANEYLQRVVQKAVNESERGVVGVPENEVEATKDDLDALPLVTFEEADSAHYEWGYYVRYNRTVVRVRFAVLE